jgi:hypothetical protein
VLAPQGAVVQPRWTSASFLLYAGGIVVLAAAGQALADLAHDYGDAAFAGWAALVFVLLAAFAVAFHGSGRWVAAGVFAVSAVVGWGVFVGALEEWFGWFPHASTPLHGFHVAVLLLALLVLLAALAALRVFRFPLLVVVVVAATWYFVTDLISNGGNWSAVVTLLVGLFYFFVVRSVDAGPARPYAFWLHVAAGIAVGGALLTFWHESDGDWALVAIAALAYVAVAAAVRRTSYAVLGAYGLYLAAIHFASEWSDAGESAGFYPYLPFFLLYPVTQGFDYGSSGRNDWAAPLTYAFLGFLLVGLGLLLERQRAAAVAAPAA